MQPFENKTRPKQASAIALVLWLTTSSQGTLASAESWQLMLKEGDRRILLPDFAGAEAAYRQALKDVRRSKDRDADNVAKCMQSLARVLQLQDLTEEESRPLYKKSLKILERKHGPRSQEVLQTLLIIGAVYEQDGDYKRAGKYYARSLSIATDNPGPQSLLFAECSHRLGRVKSRLGLTAEAATLFRSALQVLLTQNELPSATRLENILIDYSELLKKSNQSQRLLASSSVQKELLKDQIEKLPQTQGVQASKWSAAVTGRLADPQPGMEIKDGRIVPPPPTTPQAVGIVPDRSLNDIVALEKIGEQRVDFYERMIEIDVQSLGPDHPSVARDLGGLAALHMRQKQYDKAKPLLERALQIYKTNYGDQALLVKRTQGFLEIIDHELNPVVQPHLLLDDYTASLPRIPVQAQTLEMALRLNELAYDLYIRGQVAEAEKVYGWALAATSRASGTQSSLVAACLNDYAKVLRSTGKPADAERLEKNAQAIVRKALSNRAGIQ